MQEVSEKGGIQGTVIVRSHPAGTIDTYQALVKQGKLAEAQDLIKSGEVKVRQKNIIVFSLNYGYDILVQFLLSAYNGSFSINNGLTLTGTTDGSTGIITGLSTTSGLAPGMLVSGVGIPAYSAIISINSGTSVTISQNTTASGAVSLVFAQIQQLGIAWGEIGTGSTAPANTDVALTTPTNRASVSYGADSGFNEAQIQFFFPDASLANQTYYEFGTFIGGSSTIGSGNMFNHALFATPYVKTAGTDTTCETDFEFGS
jgi:hypothetical protein